MENAYILSAKRTPIGSFQGQLSTLPAPKLGATAIQAAISEAGLQPADVEEVIFGQVLTAGTGQAPARQAAIYAGIPTSAVCMTINKVCGSGLKSVMLANDSIRLGESQIVVAGGQENMTQAPHLLENARAGYRMGHVNATDSMIKDGLWDPYNDFHMGMAAEMCVKERSFTREEQDQFAKESYEWAQKATEAGHFKNEIVEVEVKNRKGSVMVTQDEDPYKVKFEKISGLRPAFDREGSVTAANASNINDGAAALVLASPEAVKSKNLKPIAKIVGQASFAQDPKWFTTAPVEAMKKVSEKTGIAMTDIDLFEINEAFAVVTMAAMKELDIPRDKVNVHGGSVAIG
ncbi:MAG: thiolase family protein, partial [Pseudomonadota bacterium]